MSETNARRMGEIRATLDTQLMQLQQGNAAKLDEMRAVVDEKLQATLHQRLGESFKQVSYTHLTQPSTYRGYFTVVS